MEGNVETSCMTWIWNMTFFFFCDFCRCNLILMKNWETEWEVKIKSRKVPGVNTFQHFVIPYTYRIPFSWNSVKG